MSHVVARTNQERLQAGLDPNKAQIVKCSVICCDRKANGGKGYCSGHYKRLKRGKQPLDTPLAPIGPFRQGYTDSEGYRRIGKQKVHRIVMEQIVGRKLLPNESVHHKNGNRQDNSPDNLELWSDHQPRGARIDDQVEHALKILKTYRPDLLKGN